MKSEGIAAGGSETVHLSVGVMMMVAGGVRAHLTQLWKLKISY